MSQLVEMSSSRDHWVGAYGPLLMLFWTRSVEPAVYDKLVDQAQRLASHQDGGSISVLSVALPGARSPSNEGRRAMVELLRETDGCVSRIAIVREGQGFISSTVASVMIGLRMLAKPLAGHKFFHTLSDGVVWAVSELEAFKSGRLSVEAARTIVEHQRRTLVTRWATKTEQEYRTGPSI